MQQYFSISLLILILSSQFVFTNCSFSKFEAKNKNTDSAVTFSLGQNTTQTIPTGSDVRYMAPDGGTVDQCNGESLTAFQSSGSNCAWNNLDEALTQNEVLDQTVRLLYLKSGSYDLTVAVVFGLKLVGDCQNQPVIKTYKSIGAFNIEMHQAQVDIQCITVTDF